MAKHFAFLFPRFKLLSGAERLILKLAGALEHKGHTVSILCHQFDSTCNALLTPNSKLVVSGKTIDFFRNRYLNAAFDYFWTKSIIELLPAKLDAICCFGPALTLLPTIKKTRHLPVLYFCYEPPRFLYTDHEIILDRLGLLRPFASSLFRVYRQKDQKLVKSADRVLSNSEFGRKQIQEVYKCDARVITHGLDPFQQGTRRAEIRGSWQFADQDIALLTVNYLHPRKRIELFLDTLNRARQLDPTVKGVVIGDGPERSKLEKQANDSIRFTGFVPEESLHEYFQAADIYLHTGRLETFGLSVIEASANYLPVVSVNEGGPLETVIDGKTGFLCEASPDSLAEAVLNLAKNPDQRKLFGENGYWYVRGKYLWQKGAEDFVSAFEEIL
jgi:glycosyltransferase involved in cell wall biosynthesis